MPQGRAPRRLAVVSRLPLPSTMIRRMHRKLAEAKLKTIEFRGCEVRKKVERLGYSMECIGQRIRPPGLVRRFRRWRGFIRHRSFALLLASG